VETYVKKKNAEHRYHNDISFHQIFWLSNKRGYGEITDTADCVITDTAVGKPIIRYNETKLHVTEKPVEFPFPKMRMDIEAAIRTASSTKQPPCNGIHYRL
jgi:hypothetical protein